MGIAWFNGWEVVGRTFIAGTVTYLALVLMLRITGPRTLAKWYAFDLIITVALGSTYATGVLSHDVSIVQAVAGFLLLVALQYLIGRTSVAYPRFVRWINPAPVLLLAHGEEIAETMARNRVTRADLCKAARSHGFAALEDIAAMVLEPDGTFSVITQIDGRSTSALDDVPSFRDRFRGTRSNQTTDQASIV